MRVMVRIVAIFQRICGRQSIFVVISSLSNIRVAICCESREDGFTASGVDVWFCGICPELGEFQEGGKRSIMMRVIQVLHRVVSSLLFRYPT